MNPYQQEQLEIISRMIESARKDLKDNGVMFLFWGWLVFSCAMANYILLKLGAGEASFMPWMLMPVGAVVSVFIIRKEIRAQRVKTWVDTVMKYTWTASSVCLGLVLIFHFKLGSNAYPMTMMMYGIGTFITGGILQFRYLLWGGVCCWVLAIAAMFVSFENQLLLLAASLLIAYIIPGHILNRNFHRKDETPRSRTTLTVTPGGGFPADDSRGS